MEPTKQMTDRETAAFLWAKQNALEAHGEDVISWDGDSAWAESWRASMRQMRAVLEAEWGPEPEQEPTQPVARRLVAEWTDRPDAYAELVVVIETMGVVDEIGINPQRTATAPPFFAEHLRRLSASQELTIDAALTGDRDLVLAALMTDPFASRIDYAQLRRMADDLLAANAEYLPQFS